MFLRTSAALLAAFLIAPVVTAQSIDWNDPDAVVRAAVDVNPSLASLTAQIQAAKERAASAGSLPNPMLMGGVQNQTLDLSYDFMTMYMVGASQTFVRKSRRESLRRSAQLEVERLERGYESSRAEVERDVRTAYIAAASAQNQVAATEEIARIAGSIVDAARIAYETGSAPQADMIRARLEQSNILHELLTLRRERKMALAALLPLLNLPLSAELPPFSLRHEMERHREHGFDTVVADTPATAALETEIALAEEEIRFARLAGKPDFDIEASYGLRPQDMDMVSVVARIEFPFRKSAIIEPRIREAIASRDAARQQIEVLRQQLRQDAGTAIALRDEAIEQINLHVERLVPESKLAFESAIAAYSNGKTTFDAVLGSLQAWRGLNVDYYGFLKQQLEAEIDIDALRRGSGQKAEGRRQKETM